MSTFKFPKNILDRPREMLGLLGSFWSEEYQGKGILEDLAEAKGRVTQENLRGVEALTDSVSRHKIPTVRRMDWAPIRFLESSMIRYQTDFPRYDGTYQYQEDSNIQYGVSVDLGRFAVDSLPLEELRLLMSNISLPKKILFRGSDFVEQDGLILFSENPFESPDIPITLLLGDDGSVVDRQIQLWFPSPKEDEDRIQNQFGYATNSYFSSDEPGKQLLNSSFNCWVDQTTVLEQKRILAGIYGIPLVESDVEVVEKLHLSEVLTVITDKEVYFYNKSTTPLVSVGDIVRKGDCLTDALQIFETTEQKDVPSWIDSINVGNNYLGTKYMSSLTFENKVVPIVNHGTVDGYTKVSWELGGYLEDQNLFWSEVHAKGVSDGKTLAMYLDREISSSQTPEDLPDNVNPLKILLKTVWRYNTVIARVKYSSKGNNESRVKNLWRQISPPHVNFVILLDSLVRDTMPEITGEGSTTSLDFVDLIDTLNLVWAENYRSLVDNVCG